MVLRDLFRAKARIFYLFQITGLKAGVSHLLCKVTGKVYTKFMSKRV